MAMSNAWSNGNPFNWRGQRDAPVTPHYRDREPGSIGENQKFPPVFLEIFGPPPYNRRLLAAGTTIGDRAKAHIEYTTAWRDYIGVVDYTAFAPFGEEFDSRLMRALGVVTAYMNTDGSRVYHTWTGSRKTTSVFKVAFPQSPIWNTTMVTPVPFHCSLAKLLGADDDGNHRRISAESVVAEYQELMVQSGEHVEGLVGLLAGSHIAAANEQLGREKVEREAAEQEERRIAREEASNEAGKPASLNELLGWTS